MPLRSLGEDQLSYRAQKFRQSWTHSTPNSLSKHGCFRYSTFSTSPKLETIVAVQCCTRIDQFSINPTDSTDLHSLKSRYLQCFQNENEKVRRSKLQGFLILFVLILFVSCKLHSRSVSLCWRCFPLQTELKRRRRESKIRRELVMQGITDEAMPSTSQLYGGFRKWRYSYHRIIENLIKWMIWGYQYLRKLTYSLWIYISLAAMKFTLKIYWWC